MIVTFDRNPHLTEDQKIDSLARSVQLALNEKADKDTASQTFVDKDTAAQYVIKSALLDMVHPVGSYYETSDATFDPNATWGGTWTQVSGAALSTDAAEVIANIVSFNIGRARSSHVSVTAPNVTGYTFVCWGEVATNGWVGGVYPADPTSQTSNFWVAVSDGQTTSANVRAVAIYRKDKTPVNRWHRAA